MGDTRRGVRATRLLAVLAIVGSALVMGSVQPTSAAPAASYTGTHSALDGDGHCSNGPPVGDPVNCNMYDGKEFVWLNGGPVSAALGDGDFFFAVLAPGGQADPNDSTPNNLSDDFDAYTDRTFTSTGGTVTYSGTHDFDSNKIRLVDYADTTNNGGVYILAVCSLGNGYPVEPSACKYDAFKVKDDTPDDPNPPAADLAVTKDAAGAYDTTYTWNIAKAVDKTYVEASGGNVTFNYTLTLTPNAGTPGNYTVSGNIQVFNPNVDGNGDTLPVIADVTDELSDNTACTVTGGDNAVIDTFEKDFDYTCSLSGAPAGQLDNIATVSWDEQDLDADTTLAAGSAQFTFSSISFTEGDPVDECVDVVDYFDGDLVGDDKGQVCVDDAPPPPTDIKYSRDIPVPATGCATYDNEAVSTTVDDLVEDSATASVEICKLITGGHTIGFWQNKNGQAVITGGLKTGNVCNVGTSLRTYAPFQDLSATATCPQVATYVTNVIKAASAKGAAMNAMLKAQMLGTALATFFSEAPNNTLYGAPAPLGPQTVDLTDLGTSGGFGGGTCMSVSALLTYASGQSSSGGSSWYGQNKTTQGYAKDTFDAINNNAAITC